MKARVKDDFRWNTVMAFAGVEFVKDEFRPVPMGYEDEAKKHPYLEIQRASKPKAKVKSKSAAGPSVKELKAKAKDLGVKRYGRMNKAKLLAAIAKAEG